MGGYCSGDRTRPKKPTCEIVGSIDIRILHQHGALVPGSSGTLSWVVGSRHAGEAEFQVYEKSLTLDAGTVRLTIQFARTDCYFGGKRTWFLCSECNARIAILYGGNKGLACRQCNELKYACQSESPLDRQYRKIRKFRKILGGSENLIQPLWLKPKGMHRETFERLLGTEKKLKQHLQIEMLAGF